MWRFAVFSRAILKTMLVAALTAGLVVILAAQEKKKEWKDRAEYDLFESITKTQDPNQWLQSLDKWKQQYPQSDYADLRRKLYLAAYRQLNKPRQAFDAAQEVLKDNPDDLVALSVTLQFIYPLVPANTQQLNDQQKSDLDLADKAAHTVLDNLDAVYSKDNRPTEMTDDQAAKAKPEMKVFAQKTIGYIALVRKDYERAVTELTATLRLDPAQGQVSYWLGTATLAQNKTKPELQPVALFDFARAAAYSGPGCLPALDRQQISNYLTTVYVQYHGSKDGLDQLLAAASSNALAPAGFSIKTKNDIEREKEAAQEAADKANPMLALWRSIRKELVGDNGQAYFDNSVKGAELPGGANGVMQFKGKLVSMMPENRPKELVLAVEDPSKPDVTLKLDSALAGKMDPGAEISFSGVADSFTKDPFMVTFNVEKSKIEGWTGKNPPAHKKKTGGF
jgi:tetratricopeptide (TPR) repeat protein